MLVWEPKRVVRTYAVAIEEVGGEIAAARPGDASDASSLGVAALGAPQAGGPGVFDPRVPLAVRTAEGQPLMIRAERAAAAFCPAGARA